MLVSDLTFEVRDASLNRVGQLTPDDGLTTFKATVRMNNVGSWEITIPENRPLADALRTPGYGLIVTGPNGVIISGPTVAATKTNESGSPIGSWLIRGADDTIVLGERLAYPTPTTADVTAQTSAYDSVTSVKASTAMIGYITRNIGSAAPAARKISSLTTVADPAIGSNISYAARFDLLGQVMSDIAAVDGLAFDMYQSGSNIVFNVWQPTDRTATIRLDVANNTLQKSSYGYGYGVSRAIVGGQGEGASRTFQEVTSSASLLTESSFGRRVERFVDQRQESDAAKLTVAGQSTLADAGGLITSVDVVPSNDTTMRPLVDFNLGDKVTVVIASQEVAAVITQLALSVTDVGVYVGITVGSATGVDFEAITAKRQADISSRVSSLELIGNAVPKGGTTGQTLVKSSNSDFATGWGQIGSAGIADGSVTPAKIGGSNFIFPGVLSTGTVSATSLSTTGGISSGSNIFIGRNDTSAEGGQIDIARASDNATAWSLDVYGSGATPSLRFLANQSPWVMANLDWSGNLQINGALRDMTGFNKIGMVPIKPTSIGINGGSASWNSTTGAISFTGTTIVQPNGVFTSAYKYYRIIARFVNATADAGYAWRLAAGGSWNTNAYYHFVLQWNGGSGYGAGVSNNNSLIGFSLGHKYGAVSMDIINPAISGSVKHLTAQYSGLNAATSSNESHTIGATFRDVNYVADGISLFTSTSTFAGDMTVYGYN